jgi:hypothetical protein
MSDNWRKALEQKAKEAEAADKRPLATVTPITQAPSVRSKMQAESSKH